MAKPQASGGSGTVTVSADAVNLMLQQAIGLPTNFFVTISKAKVLTDGSLQATYNFSNDSAPPPPTP